MIIDDFQINDPIRSLFKPRFEIVPMDQTEREHSGLHGDVMKLTIDALNADGNGQVIQIQLRKPYDPQWMTDDHVIRFMRAMLHEILLHEADESITVHGRRVFDPHKEPGR